MDKEFEEIIRKLVVQHSKGLVTDQEFWDEVNYVKAKFGKVLI